MVVMNWNRLGLMTSFPLGLRLVQAGGMIDLMNDEVWGLLHTLLVVEDLDGQDLVFESASGTAANAWRSRSETTSKELTFLKASASPTSLG